MSRLLVKKRYDECVEYSEVIDRYIIIRYEYINMFSYKLARTFSSLVMREKCIHSTYLRVIQGDITLEVLDAIGET